MRADSADPALPDVWKDLDRRFRAPLFSYFLRRVKDRSEAEDLTQEVFARLARQAQQPHTDIQAYVFVTAANLLKDRNRLHATHAFSAHRSLDLMAENALAVPSLVEDRTPERVLDGKDRLRIFVNALEELGERTRDIFILARIERMSQRDIANLFGISVSAVEKHIMKALSHLGAELGKS